MDPVRLFAILSWILLPTVMYGGYSLLDLTVQQNPFLTEFREKSFRAGHAMPECYSSYHWSTTSF